MQRFLPDLIRFYRVALLLVVAFVPLFINDY